MATFILDPILSVGWVRALFLGHKDSSGHPHQLSQKLTFEVTKFTTFVVTKGFVDFVVNFIGHYVFECRLRECSIKLFSNT